MDSQDQRKGVENVIRILRKVTSWVRLAPFAYLCLFAAYMLLGAFLSERVLCIADSLMTVTPIATGSLLAASRVFRFCGWHKAACLLPMSGHAEGWVDSHIITFTQGEVVLINTLIGIAALAFVILAIKHFSHGR